MTQPISEPRKLCNLLARHPFFDGQEPPDPKEIKDIMQKHGVTYSQIEKAIKHMLAYPQKFSRPLWVLSNSGWDIFDDKGRCVLQRPDYGGEQKQYIEYKGPDHIQVQSWFGNLESEKQKKLLEHIYNGVYRLLGFCPDNPLDHGLGQAKLRFWWMFYTSNAYQQMEISRGVKGIL